MKCHYEILGVARDSNDDEIKKAYRKLALKWHPDKNLENPSEAKEQFQLIQQAYDVLSDSHERAWYDNHREAILKGGIGDNYKDDSIDLFQYFTTTCYRSYGDDEKGFYAVYRRVFETLAAEDAEFARDGDSDDEAPSFGDSKSPYELVHNFYSYWQSYSTKRSFAWLDPYDIRDTPNRRVLRLVEKENKKIRDKAKRERNEQVRNLVSFVRKRDKRVQANAERMAERARENALKAQEFKKQKLLQRQAELREHKISDWSKFSNIEAELRTIEVNLAAEFGEELSDDEENIVDSGALYCVACNKIFKTQKAFTNHENSKKHRDNLTTLKTSMIEENEDTSSVDESDTKLTEGNSITRKAATGPEMADFLLEKTTKHTEDSNVTSDEELNSDSEDSVEPMKENPTMKKSKTTLSSFDDAYVYPEGSKVTKDTKVTDDEETSPEELISDEEEIMTGATRKKRNKVKSSCKINAIIDSEEENFGFDVGLSKKQRKKRRNAEETLGRKGQPETKNDLEVREPETRTIEENEETMEIPKIGKTKGKRAKEQRKAQKFQDKRETKNSAIQDTAHRCVTCKNEFSSKNKLFEHLKKTGHSVYLPSAQRMKTSEKNKSRGRARSESDSS